MRSGEFTWRFTGKERDAETGLDYFEARYFSGAQGRFTSPDPLDWLASQHGNEDDRRQFQAYIADPQNLNLYAYVRNNPLRFTDPHGLYYCTGTKDQCAAFQVGLDRAREALKSDKLTANQRAAINKVLGFLGDAQKANGVVVKFGPVMTGAGGQTGSEKAPDGSLVVTITLPTSILSKSTDRQAEVDIHEGQHGVDDKARGRDPFTFPELLTTETNAYTVQSYVMMGLMARSGNGLWDPTWGADVADKIALLGRPLNAQTQTEGREAIDANLCEVVAHSERYANKPLRLHAQVDSDGMHTTLLADPRCKTGILLYNSEEVENAPGSHPDIQALERAIEEGQAGTLHKRLEGTFTGMFLVERNGTKLRRLMKLQSVTSLRVSAREEPHRK